MVTETKFYPRLPLPGAWTRAVVHSYSVVIIGVFYWLPMSIVFVTTKVKRISRKLGFSLAVLLAVFVPVSRWDTFARSSLWEHFLRYFQVQVVGASPPKPGKTGGIVYGIAPHGIVPYSLGLLQYGSLGSFLGYPRITTASVVRYIPLFSHMLYLGGGSGGNDDRNGQSPSERRVNWCHSWWHC